jgi:hypothetical protein
MAYTNIDDPSAYFQTAIYSGSNSDLSVTNDGNSDLKPDFLWIKQRSSTESHMLVDSTRGVSKYLLSNSTDAELTVTSIVETLDTDGFTLNGASNPVNALGATYVGWQWKANGGTTASNTDGSITSTVQANQDAGFSIVTYTGTGTAATIGHGLGVAPAMYIVKNRDQVGTNWTVFHKDLTSNAYSLYLSDTTAQSNAVGYWNGTSPTSTVFSIKNTSGDVNTNTEDYVAYCFASKQGYSKFGKYVGNGSADGPFIYTGFRPAFIITKKSSAAGGGWFMQDIKRGIKNNDTTTPVLQANGSFSEADIGTTNYEIDFLSNGFKLRDSNTYVNLSATTYIFMAFAENPFVTSTGIPATAR